MEKYVALIGIILVVGILVYHYKPTVQKPIKETSLSAALKKVTIPTGAPFFDIAHPDAAPKITKGDSGWVDHLLGCEINCP